MNKLESGSIIKEGHEEKEVGWVHFLPQSAEGRHHMFFHGGYGNAELAGYLAIAKASFPAEKEDLLLLDG